MSLLTNDINSVFFRLVVLIVMCNVSNEALPQSKLRTNVSSSEKKVITFNAFEKNKKLKEQAQAKLEKRKKDYRYNIKDQDLSEYVPEAYSGYYESYKNATVYSDEFVVEFDSLKNQPFEEVRKHYDLPTDMDSTSFYSAMDQYVFNQYNLEDYEKYQNQYNELNNFDSVGLDQLRNQDSLLTTDSISEDVLTNHFSKNDWLVEMKKNETDLLSNFRNEDFLLKEQEYIKIDELGQEVSQAFETVKKKEEKKNFLRELVNQKSPEYDSASAIQRFDGGGFMEVSENFKSIHFAPFIEYNVTAKILLGFGVNTEWDITGRPSLSSTAYRYYTEYRIKKFFIHAESESAPNVRGEQATYNAQSNYLLGVGRHFLIKKRVAGRIMLLMNLTDNTDQTFTLRYGFNIF